MIAWGVVSAVGVVLVLYQRVEAGAGTAHYFTVDGIRTTPISSLVTLGLLTLAWLLLPLVLWWDGREERDLLRKYGADRRQGKPNRRAQKDRTRRGH